MTRSSEDSSLRNPHYDGKGDRAQGILSSGSSADQDMDPIQYLDFTEDGDVIERIKSRASVTSDIRQLRSLREKYKEGFFQLSRDDPRRPQQWSLRKRIAHTLAFGVCSFTGLLAATVFTPAGFQFAQQKSVGSELGVLAFSTFLLGNTVGTIFITPATEAYGRKVSVLAPTFISGVFLCVLANCDSMASAVVYRFLAGVFAAGPISCSSGVVADLWRPKVRANAFAMFSLNFITGATISPILGALMTHNGGSYGWRWCAWLGGLLSLITATGNLLFLSETYCPVVEKRLAKNIKLETGFWGLHTKQDKYNELNIPQTLLIYVRRPLHMMTIPTVLSIVLYSAFNFGVFFLLVVVVGDQFRSYHDFSFVASHCPLIGILIGFHFGCLANILASQRYAGIAVRTGSKPAAEVRLLAMMVLGWMFPGGLFIFGWTMRSSIHWIVPIIGLGLVGAGLATTMQGCANYLIDGYTEKAASASAANNMTRYIFAGVFPLFSRQLFYTLDAGWASSLLAFIGVAMLPIPWAVYYWGASYRHHHDPHAAEEAVGGLVYP